MDASDKVPEAVRTTLENIERRSATTTPEVEKKPYRFWPRLGWFTVVLAIAGTLFAAIFVPLAIGMAMSAGAGGGAGLSGLLLIAIVVALIVAAVLIFKP